MKVFITGVAGFLGSHLADYFIDNGYEVVGNDNLIGGDKSNVPDDIDEFYPLDCCDFEAMKKITDNVDILYHCAAHPHEGLSVFSPALVNKSVYQSTASILSAFIHNKGKRFVFTSSMARYGSNNLPFTEDMKPRPQDPYGLAKVNSEDLIKLLSRVHNFEYNIAVPHNIYGPRQKYDDPFRNVISIFINRMIQGKQPIIYGDGKQTRCFSFIDDDIMPLVRMGVDKSINREIINIGPDKEFVTINVLAEKIADKLDFDLNPVYEKDRPQEVKHAYCSSGKSRRLLNYTQDVFLNEGLDYMIEWIRNKGPKDFKYYLDLEIINDKTPNTWRNKLI